MAPLIPQARPGFDRAKVESVLSEYLAKLDPKKYPVVFFGLRGFYGTNKRGVYDDAIGMLERQPAGLFMICNGNTDPSAQYRKNLGCIHAPQQYFVIRGKHRGYDAFRQGGTIKVDRDGVGLVDAPIGCAFNLHRGGANGTSSLGCQTVVPAQWPAFQATGYMITKKYGMTLIPYILLKLS